jgi:uncharacterized cupredoxin-like copper-binding protein
LFVRVRNGIAGAALGAALLLLGSACSGGGGLKTTQKDFSITLDKDTAKSGEVEFDIHNEGPSTHEFVVFKTDLAPDQLPVDSAGAVDESGQGVTHIDEQENITSGSTVTFKVNLDPGKYVVICNLPGHYQQGMHAGLTVT